MRLRESRVDSAAFGFWDGSLGIYTNLTQIVGALFLGPRDDLPAFSTVCFAFLAYPCFCQCGVECHPLNGGMHEFSVECKYFLSLEVLSTDGTVKLGWESAKCFAYPHPFPLLWFHPAYFSRLDGEWEDISQ